MESFCFFISMVFPPPPPSAMTEAAAVALATLQNKLVAFGPSVTNLSCVEAVCFLFLFVIHQKSGFIFRCWPSWTVSMRANWTSPMFWETYLKVWRADWLLWIRVFSIGSLVKYTPETKETGPTNIWQSNGIRAHTCRKQNLDGHNHRTTLWKNKHFIMICSSSWL